MKNLRTIFLPVLALALLPLTLGGCRSSTDRSEGAVLLSISNFDLLPVAVDLSESTVPVTIGTLTLRNITKDPTGSTSDLQSIRAADGSYLDGRLWLFR
jgi:hypothetical protein